MLALDLPPFAAAAVWQRCIRVGTERFTAVRSSVRPPHPNHHDDTRDDRQPHRQVDLALEVEQLGQRGRARAHPHQVRDRYLHIVIVAAVAVVAAHAGLRMARHPRSPAVVVVVGGRSTAAVNPPGACHGRRRSARVAGRVAAPDGPGGWIPKVDVAHFAAAHLAARVPCGRAQRAASQRSV